MADENGKDSSLDRRSSIAESSDSYDSYFTAETSIPSATIFSETISSIRTEESTNVQELIQTALGEIQPDAYIDFNSSFTLFDVIASITGKASNDVKAEVIEVLKTHRKQFQLILKLFNNDENTSTASMNEKEQLRLEREAYDHLITQCNGIDSLEKKHQFPIIFAAATIIHVPIYIFCEADYAKFTWQFFPPLLGFPEPPIPTYMTLYMSPDGKFSQITTENVPKSKGILGYFLEILEATAACDIDLPKQLLNISKDKKDEMIRRGSKTSLRQACNLLGNTLRLDSAGIGDSNNDKNGDDIMEHFLLHNSEEDFLLYCKILIKSSDFKALEVGISDWDAFVAECEYTRRFMTLSELDQVIVERNIEVGSLVRACNEGGEELDKRRKTVNRTVIASSTVGLVGGGLAITGLALAPFSFGASLGLTIAGGAIGVATGATSGGARTVEAVKQNTKIKDIKGKLTVVEKLETDISGKLKMAQESLSNTNFALDRVPQEIPGISRRGFMAVGSAARSVHSGVSIALAAARLSATTASFSAAIIGPLSLVFDIAFLAEAIDNTRKGDRTNASKKLKDTAATVDVKHRVFNSVVRGNCFDLDRLVVIETV